MKRHIIFIVLVFLIQQVNAQEEVTTTVIKLKDLITHSADAYPNEEAQQIYLLIETNASGISSDSRFFLEQGIQLLLKRLQPEDTVAIGTYGASNTTIVAYTEVSNSSFILQELQKIYMIVPQNEHTDGLDMAYQFAKSKYIESRENKVIMIRSDLTPSQAIAINSEKEKEKQKKEEKTSTPHTETGKSLKLGGTIAITALSILPEVLEIIKN